MFCITQERLVTIDLVERGNINSNQETDGVRQTITLDFIIGYFLVNSRVTM